MNPALTRIAMTTAGLMLAHKVAGSALRDATFLTAWPASALPLMTLATAVLIGAFVPILARFFERYSSIHVMAFGFGASAAGHLLEWALFDAGRWIAVVIYLHLAGIGALLLSGFWSVVAERFDPANARMAYGRIAAAGTVGGIIGSLAAERIATAIAPHAVLPVLAALDVFCAVGVTMLGRSPALMPTAVGAENQVAGIKHMLRAPYVRTIASVVLLTSASSAIGDFLLKANATATFGTGAVLLRFFAVFYGSVQVLSFVAQTQTGRVLRRLGVSGSLPVLPALVGAAAAFATIVPGWRPIAALRGTDAVVRNSLFRGGYELLFVPMDARTRNRVKGTLDVICDRLGEAAGCALVQLGLLAGVAPLRTVLLAAAMMLAAAAIPISRRLGQLYFDVIEDELLKYSGDQQVSLVSESGWTVLPVSAARHAAFHPATRHAAVPAAPIPPLEPHVQVLADLRSRDVARITSAVGRPAELGRIHVAQIIDLLAWDAVSPAARTALEELAPAHVGMLVDALLDPATDFAIRRRLPRILGTIPSERSLDGLVRGLDDSRFEVRYHCSRAIQRILTKEPALSIDRMRMIAVVERELSIPAQRWRDYRLLDVPDGEPEKAKDLHRAPSQHLEHVFRLLSTIVRREPLDAALQGVRSPYPGVRGLAEEYFEQVLPSHLLDRLRELIASTPSGSDVPSQSAGLSPARRSSEEH